MWRFSSFATRVSSFSAIGSAVRDPGRQLLERDVGADVEQRLVAGVVADLHRLHPRPLELVRVDAPGHQQVVPDAERVPPLLGGPAVHPGAPGTVAPERPLDLTVVAGQVVLGQQVHLERGPRDRGERRLLDRPGLTTELGEVAAERPGDELVRHPLLGRGQVAVEVLLDDGLELGEQLGVGDHGHRGSWWRDLLPTTCRGNAARGGTFSFGPP
jgi:hypothetical protein